VGGWSTPRPLPLYLRERNPVDIAQEVAWARGPPEGIPRKYPWIKWLEREAGKSPSSATEVSKTTRHISTPHGDQLNVETASWVPTFKISSPIFCRRLLSVPFPFTKVQDTVSKLTLLHCFRSLQQFVVLFVTLNWTFSSSVSLHVQTEGLKARFSFLLRT
jgi:hypothetical protein